MTLKGCDISSWQADTAVDLGADFVICKATEGVGYVDPTCDPKYQRAKSQNKQRGVYHFARPGYGNTAEDEAKFFLENVQGYIKHSILILDWEDGNKWDTAWAKRWLDYVYKKTGVRPLIYMSASVVTAYDWSAVANAGYGLWIAGYPSKYNKTNPPTPSDDEMPYSSGAFPFIAMWQYTSSAGTLDRNIFYGDVTAWRKYAGADDAKTTKTETKTETKKEETKKEEPKKEEVGNPGKETVEDNDKVRGDSEPESTDTGISKEDYLESLKKIQASLDLVTETAKLSKFSFVMKSSVYDVLKKIALLLPIISTLYMGLSQIWGFGFGEQVDATIILIVNFINAILGLTVVKASSDYHKGDIK